MYGLTECKRVSYLPPGDIDRKTGSVGIPIPNSEVFIVDEEGRPVSTGTIGELVVRGANVMQGYWNAPEETRRVFQTGRYGLDVQLFTGDLFQMDADGYLYFVSRKDDMIKSKGEKVSPVEIETILCEMEMVAEAAVIGIPDAILGSAIKAFVVPPDSANPDPETIRRYCARHLEPVLVPKEIVICRDLPKTANGKVDKKKLLAAHPPKALNGP